MLDNKEKYHPTELADKGWSAMREMLDREMPVARKKRRVAIWWWATIGLGIFLLIALQVAGYSFWSLLSPTPPAIQQEKPIEPAAIPPVAEKRPTQGATAQPLADASTLEYPTPNDQEAISRPLPHSTVPQQPIALTLPSQKTTPLFAENAAVRKDRDGQQVSQLSKQEIASAKLLHLADLPRIPIKPLDEKPLASDLSPSAPKKHWIFSTGLEAGIFHQAWLNQGGWNAGVFTQVQQAHSRFHAKAGIRYSQSSVEFLVQQIQITGDSLADQSNTDFPVTQDGIEAGYSADKPGVLFTSLQPRHQIGVPIEMGYRISKKWTVLAGLQANYLISSQRGRYFSEDLNAAFDPDKAFFYDSVNGAISLRSGSPAPRDTYRSFHLALSGGIAYQINPKLSLSLQYRQGLTNLTPSGQYASRLKGLELMLSRRFGF